MVLTDSRKLKAKLPPMVGTKCCAACVLHDPQSPPPAGTPARGTRFGYARFAKDEWMLFLEGGKVG